jgi:hypothetical protein
MKNVFFAVAFMLLGTFAFANTANELSSINSDETVKIFNSLELVDNSENSKVLNNFEFFGTCYVTIGFYDSDGNKVAERTLQFNNVDSEAECDGLADAVEEALENL